MATHETFPIDLDQFEPLTLDPQNESLTTQQLSLIEITGLWATMSFFSLWEQGTFDFQIANLMNSELRIFQSLTRVIYLFH